MEMVSRPPSTSRVTLAPGGTSSIFEAKVACGQPRSAANICPVWFESSSIACLPRITSCGVSFCTIAFNSFATASGCSSSALSTRMARSAPIARAVRSVSWQACAPHDPAAISGARPASLRRTAASTAISSKGFIDIFTFAVSTPVLSALTRTLTLKSTTRLTATRTFMRKIIAVRFSGSRLDQRIERERARIKHHDRIDVDRRHLAVPVNHGVAEPPRHARERAQVARRLPAQRAKERRDAQLGELREHLVLAAGREQQAEVLQRFEIDAAVAHQQERPELRVESRAERELASAAGAPRDDHALEARAELPAFLALAAEFGERVGDAKGDEAMVALVRQVGRACLEHHLRAEHRQRRLYRAFVTAQVVLDDGQPGLREQREALRLVEEAPPFGRPHLLCRR